MNHYPLSEVVLYCKISCNVETVDFFLYYFLIELLGTAHVII